MMAFVNFVKIIAVRFLRSKAVMCVLTCLALMSSASEFPFWPAFLDCFVTSADQKALVLLCFAHRIAHE